MLLWTWNKYNFINQLYINKKIFKNEYCFFAVLKINRSHLWSEQWCITGNDCDTNKCRKPLLTGQPCSSLLSNAQIISIKDNAVTMPPTQSFLSCWEVNMNWQLKSYFSILLKGETRNQVGRWWDSHGGSKQAPGPPPRSCLPFLGLQAVTTAVQAAARSTTGDNQSPSTNSL